MLSTSRAPSHTNNRLEMGPEMEGVGRFAGVLKTEVLGGRDSQRPGVGRLVGLRKGK